MSHKVGKESKKQSFVSAAAISTVALILTRIISVMYTIPFSYMVRDNALTVHNYAYGMFNPFYELSLAGLPLAVARLIAMYNARGEYKTSNRILRYAQVMMLILGTALGLIFFIFAGPFANYQLQEDGSALVADLMHSMQIIAPSLLILPFMSGMRGYLQGFKTVIGTAVSQVVERLTFVIVLLIVLYVAIFKYGIPSPEAMAYGFVALPLASLVALFVLFPFYKHVRREHKALMAAEASESKETTRELFAQIFGTALPFVIAGFASVLYGTITTMLYVPLREHLGHATRTLALVEYNTIVFHTSKLISIPLTFSLAMSASIISFITSAYEGKKQDEVKAYVNRSYQLMIFTTLSSVLLMALLGKPLLVFFYGADGYTNFRSTVLTIDGFRGMCFAIETVAITILQSIGQKNRAVFYTASGPIVKLILMVPLVYLFNVYGEVLSTILGLIFVIVLATRKINAITGATLAEPISTFSRTLLCLIPSLVLIFIANILVQIFVPFVFEDRLLSFIYLAIMGTKGLVLFAIIADRTGLIREIFGQDVDLRRLRKRYLRF